MACELQGAALLVTLGNAFASTPGIAGGVVAPPLEPALVLKMWLSWAGVLVAMGVLSKCLEDNGRHQDAETLKREIVRLRQELDSLKQQVH
jgi:hypothetical protein